MVANLNIIDAYAIMEAVIKGSCGADGRKRTSPYYRSEYLGKADIHRVTFYKHFPDIYDVYEQLTKKFFSDVGIMLMERGEKTAAVFYHNMLNYVSEHSVYFKMIFSPHSTSGLYLDLLEMLSVWFFRSSLAPVIPKVF